MPSTAEVERWLATIAYKPGVTFSASDDRGRWTVSMSGPAIERSTNFPSDRLGRALLISYVWHLVEATDPEPRPDLFTVDGKVAALQRFLHTGRGERSDTKVPSIGPS